MLRPTRLDPDRAALLVIDLQEKLLPLIARRESILRRASLMIRGAGVFDLPIVVTEQYPDGIGRTDERLAALLKPTGTRVFEKTAFSCAGDEAIRARLREIDRDQIVVCGIESHVCVQQTALDLLTSDYDVYVCADAVGSRARADHDVALDRLRQAGAMVTTVESVLFELCERCGTERFKRMLALIKSSPPDES